MGVRDVTENLSAGGLFIRTDRELKVGQRVSLLLGFSPLLEPVQVEVEVVRRRLSEGSLPAGVAVKIPADREQDRAKLRSLTQAASGTVAPRQNYRLLLVEDNPLLAKMFADTLTEGFARAQTSQLSIDTATQGQEAFQRLQGLPRIDLLITDRHMPVMDGFELVRKVRADPRLKTLPIVMVSAASLVAQKEALAIGVNVYVNKPIRHLDIVKTVEALLRLRNSPSDNGPSLKG